MDTIESLASKINQCTRDLPIFYISNDPERAIGVESFLENYHIVCIDDGQLPDYLIKSGVKVFCLEKALGQLNPIFRNTNRLLSHPLASEYIRKNSPRASGYGMVFKIAPNIERTAQKLGLKLLNTSSALNRQFELKLSQYEALKNLSVTLPKTQVLDIENANYDTLLNELLPNFIMQFNRGHTGGGTVMIDSDKTLDYYKKLFPHRKVRLAEFIHGKPYTLNACVTKYGVYWGGLSLQLTGIAEATTNRNSTVGNDWHYPEKLSTKTREEIDSFVNIIGGQMLKSGYKGLFGIDLIVEDKSEKVFIIEINARQPASVPMFAKLQLTLKQIPLNLIHIAEFLGLDFSIDKTEYNKNASAPINASQLFIRNRCQDKATIVGEVKMGTYCLRGDNSAYDWTSGKPVLKPNVIFLTEEKDTPLIFEKEVYSIDKVAECGMLILAIKEGRIVDANAEIARIELRQTVLDENGSLKHWVREIAKGLQKYITVKEIQ